MLTAGVIWMGLVFAQTGDTSQGPAKPFEIDVRVPPARFEKYFERAGNGVHRTYGFITEDSRTMLQVTVDMPWFETSGAKVRIPIKKDQNLLAYDVPESLSHREERIRKGFIAHKFKLIDGGQWDNWSHWAPEADIEYAKRAREMAMVDAPAEAVQAPAVARAGNIAGRGSLESGALQWAPHAGILIVAVALIGALLKFMVFAD